MTASPPVTLITDQTLLEWHEYLTTVYRNRESADPALDSCIAITEAEISKRQYRFRPIQDRSF